MVPYPLSRGLFIWGKPIWVPHDATEEDLETKRLELETSLNRITTEADASVRREV